MGRGGYTLGRQQSILLDQDNVVLPDKRTSNNLEVSGYLRDQRQPNADVVKVEDFNTDFMNMLGQGHSASKGPDLRQTESRRNDLLPQISFSRLRSGFDYSSLLANSDQH